MYWLCIRYAFVATHSNYCVTSSRETYKCIGRATQRKQSVISTSSCDQTSHPVRDELDRQCGQEQAEQAFEDAVRCVAHQPLEKA